jgi:hypothetical protein
MSDALVISYPLDSGAVTQYLGWPFTDFFESGGVAYGLAADGIYRLGGHDDAGQDIVWSVESPLTEGGGTGGKRLGMVVLAGPLGEDVRVSTRFDGKPWRPALSAGQGQFAVDRQNFGQAMQFMIEGSGACGITGVVLHTLSLGNRRV